VIAKARVPIIKFVEVDSNIQFDISFDVENGPAAAKFIRESMTTLPPLRPLCLVVKIFLQQRELNEVSCRCEQGLLSGGSECWGRFWG
jgi:non-canonical poly(A) RNA polymerase PAPD5/7